MTALVHRSVGATLAPAFPRGWTARWTRGKRTVEEWLLEGPPVKRRRQLLRQDGVERGEADVGDFVHRRVERSERFNVFGHRTPGAASARCAAERPARRNRAEPPLIPPDA